MTAVLIDHSLNPINNEKEEEINYKDIKEKEGFLQKKYEIIHFNIKEKSIIPIISGIKLNNNITEINFSSNSIGKKGCFWLGTLFKTNPNISN